MPADWNSIRSDWRARRDPPSFLCIPEPPRIEPMEPPPVPGWVWGAASVAIVSTCAAVSWLIWFAV
jgi:hypothetical protein